MGVVRSADDAVDSILAGAAYDAVGGNPSSGAHGVGVRRTPQWTIGASFNRTLGSGETEREQKNDNSGS